MVILITKNTVIARKQNSQPLNYLFILLYSLEEMLCQET